MSTTIKLPELGENVDDGVVVDVRVAEGDAVAKGDTLLEVEAGKSNVEVPAPTAGTILEILVKKGDDIKTGQALVKIDESKNGPPPQKKETNQEESVEPRSAEKAEPISPRESDNVPEPPSREQATPDESDGQRESAPQESVAPAQLVPASPSTRLLARELGVDLAAVQPSGQNGRVTRDDVKAHVRQMSSGPRDSAAAQPTLPDFSRWGKIDHEPLNAIRKATARAMSQAWSLIPHVTQHDLADITELDHFRRQQKQRGVKLTITAFALKAAAIALRQFPRFNASLDMEKNQVILKQYFHIGVAVDTEHGLLVPVLRNVDQKSVHDLAAELTEVAELARQKKLSGEHMDGGTFTITNLGGIGGTAFTPIVKYPEVAILGMSRARSELALSGDDIVTRLQLPLSLSYDHRIIDGADAARFTRHIADLLENPLTMLLHA